MALADVVGFEESQNFRFSCLKNDELQHSVMDEMNFRNQTRIALPPSANPMSSNADFSHDEFGKKLKIQFEHGTTTLAFIFQNGVMIAVDSRATGGSYIGSQTMKKIVEINNYLLGTMAGGAADCVYWDRVLSKQCRMYELKNRERISTAAASKLMANIAFSYKGTGLSMGMMIAGYDKRGAALYYVDSDGNRTKGNAFSVGSGSVYAFGILDEGLKWDLTDDEAAELARRAIYFATYRDAMSGGIIRVYHMKNTGWVKISEEDCKDVHYKYESMEKRE